VKEAAADAQVDISRKKSPKRVRFFDGAGLALCGEPRSVGRDTQIGLLLVGQTNKQLV
jgi:hypothetical protein